MNSRVKNRLKHEISKFGITNYPSFLIIGVQKAATTSLAHYLELHPQICSSLIKELHFFNNDFNYSKGLKWYKRQFPRYKFSAKHFFEATPAYFYYPSTAKRIFEHNPNIKLLLILRNPVDRAKSAYNMYRRFTSEPKIIENHFTKPYREHFDNQFAIEFYNKSGQEFPSFKKVVEKEIKLFRNNSNLIEPAIVRRGIYHLQLKEYFNYFDRSQFYILNYSDLITNTTQTLNRIMEFLDLKKMSIIKSNLIRKNSFKHKAIFEEETLELLKEFYKPFNEELQDLLGKSFNW